MELLIIDHSDFRLSIECARYPSVWNYAVSNIGASYLYSTYMWNQEINSARIWNNSLQRLSVLSNGERNNALFFDNTEYSLWVEFNDNVYSASFCSMLQSVNNRFSYHHRRHILSGFINYGNDIGRSEINISYNIKGGEIRHFKLTFDVLSSKLNYHSDWRKIVEDIENEYRMLSIDYMKRTFHGFSPDAKGEHPDIVWWSIFSAEQHKFIKACRSIIERPRHRLRVHPLLERADKLKRLTPQIENELVEHRGEIGHLYKVEVQAPSNDTQENRFLKYALNHIYKNYRRLSERINRNSDVSIEYKQDIKEMGNVLNHITKHRFFKTIGPFKGLNQESLVLQKATGYSQVFRTWNILRRAYSLNDGLYRLQSKDIASLYEIWCFIQVSHIVKDKLNITSSDIEHKNRMELNNLFRWKLGTGEHSKILYKKDGVELAELVYNPKHTEKENTKNTGLGIENIVVPTVPQKPDIVLMLTKNDIQQGMKLTYLFDAKYRLKTSITDSGNHIDYPPDDAINQMHRYRDAIYFKSHNDPYLKKEIIGGYILFPGDGSPLDVANSKFLKTINEVNIGAFPLKPSDVQNRKLLEEFIVSLINSKATTIVESVIPQKGSFVEIGNRVLIGLVRESKRPGYFESFINSNANLYYTGQKFPSNIALHDLHYFIPYIKHKGIRDVYEIMRVRTISAREEKSAKQNLAMTCVWLLNSNSKTTCLIITKTFLQKLLEKNHTYTPSLTPLSVILTV